MRSTRPANPIFVLFLGLACSMAVAASAKDSNRKTAFGFTPFPYDISEEATEKTHQLIVDNGSIYALHFDNGIPWKETLENKPFPKKIQEE